MICIPGYSKRLFECLSRGNVNIVMITQASAEHSICIGIKSSDVTNFLKVNKMSPDIKLTSFSMNDEKVNQLLEESTVYIFCEQRKNC